MASGEESTLTGKRVVITRAVEQSADVAVLLRQRGATVISLPLISFVEPEEFFPLDAALLDWKRFDWVLFTSANAVRAVKSRGDSLGQKLGQSPTEMRIAVVGPATKAAAEEAGFFVTYVASTHLGVALAEELAERLQGKSVFLPRSDQANPDLPAALQKLGVSVTEVVAYRTVPPNDMDRENVERVLQGEADAIVFFSPTAVHNLSELVGRERLVSAGDRLVYTAVGPVTAKALRDAGVRSVVVAADTSSAHVVAALEEHFSTALRQSSARVNQA